MLYNTDIPPIPLLIILHITISSHCFRRRDVSEMQAQSLRRMPDSDSAERRQGEHEMELHSLPKTKVWRVYPD